MLIIANGERSLWSQTANATHLASLCAHLIRERKLAGCIASLPKRPDERNRLFTFLASLKSATGARMLALLPSTSLAESDFVDCDNAHVDEVIIHQRSNDAQSTIRCLLRFRQGSPDSLLGLRVWLHPSLAGDLHRTAAEWTRRFGPHLDVTVDPLELDASAREFAPAPAPGQPLACESLRSTIMIHPAGAVVPCLQHSAQAGVPLSTAPSEALAETASLPRFLGSHPTCRSCSRHMRFSIPEWMKTFPVVQNGNASEALEPRFLDNVGRRLDEIDPTERDTVVAAFLDRVRYTNVKP